MNIARCLPFCLCRCPTGKRWQFCRRTPRLGAVHHSSTPLNAPWNRAPRAPVFACFVGNAFACFQCRSPSLNWVNLKPIHWKSDFRILNCLWCVNNLNAFEFFLKNICDCWQVIDIEEAAKVEKKSYHIWLLSIFSGRGGLAFFRLYYV